MSDSLSSSFRTLLSGGMLLFVGLVLELAISFAAKLIIARFLGPTDYGAVSLGLTTLMLTTTVVLLGLNTGIGRYIPRMGSPEAKRGVLRSGLEVSLTLSIGVTVALILLAQPIAEYIFTDPSVTPILRIFALAIPFVILLRIAVGTGQGIQSSAPKVFIENITLPITRFSAVVIVSILGFGAMGIASAYAGAYILAGLISLFYLIKRVPFGLFGPRDKLHSELITFSFPLMIAATMAIQLGNIDTIVLSRFRSTDIVGIYNVVFPITQMLTLFSTSFGFLSMPIFSKYHSDDKYADMRRIFTVVSKWIFVATLPLFLAIILFPEQIIRYTFGPEYVIGSSALVILCVGFFTHAITGPNGNALTSIGRSRLIMVINIGTAVMNLGLNFALIPEFGLIGAATATTISYITINLLFSFFLYRETNIPPVTKRIYPFILYGAGSGIGLLMVLATMGLSATELFVLYSLTLIPYAVVVIRYGVAHEEIVLLNDIESRFNIDLSRFKHFAKRIMD